MIGAQLPAKLLSRLVLQSMLLQVLASGTDGWHLKTLSCSAWSSSDKHKLELSQTGDNLPAPPPPSKSHMPTHARHTTQTTCSERMAATPAAYSSWELLQTAFSSFNPAPLELLYRCLTSPSSNNPRASRPLLPPCYAPLAHTSSHPKTHCKHRVPACVGSPHA